MREEEVRFNLSFFQENISVPYEVFILDNSPEKMLHNFKPNENYIFLGKNIGTSSRNIGIQKASSPICLLLDDDSHPFPGTVEQIIEEFNELLENCAGLISEIHNPDGGREATLLPTAFHGAGVAFKTEVLRENKIFYPEGYTFYGEEYRMTLEVYLRGYELKKSPNFKVMHRRSSSGRDLNKIFYFLGRNNSAIWQGIVPPELEEKVLYDSHRRYELTSLKENVNASFQKGNEEKLASQPLDIISLEQFSKFSLIDQFDALENNEKYVLCGAGKFPSLWAEMLTKKNCSVTISDFNSGLISNEFADFKIIPPQDALNEDATFIIGHSSSIDTDKWKKLLIQNNRKYIDLKSQYELNLCQ